MNKYLLSLIFTILIVAGLFLVLRIPVSEYITQWRKLLRRRNTTGKRRREIITGEKKPSRLLRYFRESRQILIQTGRGNLYPLAQVGAALFAVAGVFLAFAMNNPFLIPVFAVCLFILPFALIHKLELPLAASFNRDMKAALGVVTSTYIQTEDIQSAVERHLELIKPPFLDVFREFIVELKVIEPNVPRALRNMARKIDSSIFREWCSVLIQCQDNKDMKQVLPATVEKIDENITVQAETDTKSSPQISRFNVLLVLNFISLPLLSLIARSWCDAMVSNFFGQFIVAVSFAAAFIALFYSIRILKPVTNN